MDKEMKFFIHFPCYNKSLDVIFPVLYEAKGLCYNMLKKLENDYQVRMGSCMAQLYQDIEKVFEKIFTKLLSLDRRGVRINGKNEKFGFIDAMILRLVGHSEGMSIFDLIYNLDVDRGIVSTSVSKLTKGKYILKERSPQDGRVFILRLTKEGETLFEGLKKTEKELVQFLLKDSTINEQKAVFKFLGRISQTMVDGYSVSNDRESG